MSTTITFPTRLHPADAEFERAMATLAEAGIGFDVVDRCGCEQCGTELVRAA